MPHNDSNEVVLHSEVERELRNLAKRAVGGKVRLSFFERQLAHDLNLDKAMDANGNWDLNEAANLTTQLGNPKRINPNALVGSNVDATKSQRGANVSKAEREALDNGDKARCARYCKMQGNTTCRYCHGEGYAQKTQRAAGRNKNHSRDLVGG